MHQPALDVKRQLHGVELESRFIDLGYELFNDRAFFTANFSTANLLSVPLDASLLPYFGKVDVIYEGSVIHLFDEPSITTFIKNVKLLLKPSSGTYIALTYLHPTHFTIRSSTSTSQIALSDQPLTATTSISDDTLF